MRTSFNKQFFIIGIVLMSFVAASLAVTVFLVVNQGVQNDPSLLWVLMALLASTGAVALLGFSQMQKRILSSPPGIATGDGSHGKRPARRKSTGRTWPTTR